MTILFIKAATRFSVEGLTYKDINREIFRVLARPSLGYYLLVGLLFLGIMMGAGLWAYQILAGLGVTGYKHPPFWGTYLVNFVFWVGIAHSGTLISAILYLFRAKWRTPIARSAEAMTVFAVMIAGLFVFIHLGRVWILYWIIPYPNQRYLWPDFQSPLIFDFFAVSTYLTVSVLFWYTGLVPDLAAVRDHFSGLRRRIYGFFSLGWTGTHVQWHHYGAAYLFMAALATPLVVSVHSVVSWDFALAIIPGYHSTIFAPYFVAGAIHSGLAMVLTLLVPLRRIFRIEKLIDEHTLQSIAKTIIVTALIVGYSYIVEFFIAWYSGNVFERQTFWFRAFGHYAPLFWIMVFSNCVAPLFFFFKKFRTTPLFLFLIAMGVNIGMWLERFVIIVGSMAQDYLPYQWGFYRPNWLEIGIMVGSFCIFLFLFFLFVKFVPPISISEMKEDITPAVRKKGERDYHGA